MAPREVHRYRNGTSDIIIIKFDPERIPISALTFLSPRIKPTFVNPIISPMNKNAVLNTPTNVSMPRKQAVGFVLNTAKMTEDSTDSTATSPTTEVKDRVLNNTEATPTESTVPVEISRTENAIATPIESSTVSVVKFPTLDAHAPTESTAAESIAVPTTKFPGPGAVIPTNSSTMSSGTASFFRRQRLANNLANGSSIYSTPITGPITMFHEWRHDLMHTINLSSLLFDKESAIERYASDRKPVHGFLLWEGVIRVPEKGREWEGIKIVPKGMESPAVFGRIRTKGKWRKKDEVGLERNGREFWVRARWVGFEKSEIGCVVERVIPSRFELEPSVRLVGL